MFQNFNVSTEPENGPKRLARLQEVMADKGVHGFIVPRSDAHRGENVPARDERLAWLTGFTGSAGACLVTQDSAALFVDGRYTLQASAQVDTGVFEQRNIPKDKLSDWLVEQLQDGQTLAFDPWLQTKHDIETLTEPLEKVGVSLKPSDNPIDQIWDDQPEPPLGLIVPHPDDLAGKDHGQKRAEIAQKLKEDDVQTAVLTLPDSIAWLLNIRGSDIARVPVPLAFALLHDTEAVELFVDERKVDDAIKSHLGPQVKIHPPQSFVDRLAELEGRVQVDKNSAPFAVSDALKAGEIIWKRDPCILPKAQKNSVELEGARQAHRRDAIAVTEFLAWLDKAAPNGTVSEIDAAQKLEEYRRTSDTLKDISFETISGAGPNGAIVHYRVNTETNRKLLPDELYLVDSGGQYPDGTTDITRTVAVGEPPEAAIQAFTAVLKGMIAISMLNFPDGLAGRDIDALARSALWSAGLDYDHGTGHGVGSYLDVHEGPASISRRSNEPLLPGMILSNEPGYYKEGAFGIRIENLIAVCPPKIPDGGDREMLSFETLTFVPIDRTLIDPISLTTSEREWLNAYHAECYARLDGKVSDHAQSWLQAATAPV